MGLRTTDQKIRCLREGVVETIARRVYRILDWGVVQRLCCTSGLRESSTLPIVRICKLERSGTYDFSSDAECCRLSHTYIETPVVTISHAAMFSLTRHRGGRFSIWKIPRVKECCVLTVYNNAFGVFSVSCRLSTKYYIQGHIPTIYSIHRVVWWCGRAWTGM